MRIALVNDTVIIVEFLRRVIATIPDYHIAWIATDGEQAITKSIVDTADLMLLDTIMPKLDGAKITRKIMTQSPCAILMVTDNLQRDSSIIFEAMGYGALDVVNLPLSSLETDPEITQILLDKIAMIGTLIGVDNKRRKRLLTRAELVPHPNQSIISSSLPFLVVIGASTGGPKAIASILSALPANFPAAIVIIQHLEYQFAPGFAQWLDNQTPLTVLLAQSGNRPEIGKVLLAATNDHLLLSADLTLKYTKEPQNYPYRPSVDVFFKSVAQHAQRKGIAILLTGMGKDGAQGLSQLRSLGWHTIAQDQPSSAIYGMPKAAVELDAATQVLPLEAIAPTLLERLRVYP